MTDRAHDQAANVVWALACQGVSSKAQTEARHVT